MEVVIDTNFLLILGVVSGCAILDLAMLKWIMYIKSLNLDIHHISRKDNIMADMLLRAQFEEEDGVLSEDEELAWTSSSQLKCRGTNKAVQP